MRHVHSCAGLCSSSEPPYRQLHKGGQGHGPGFHRADLPSILPGGRHIMVDVTVVHPLGVNMLGPASHTDAAAAKRAEAKKQQNWEAFADRPQYEFVLCFDAPVEEM